MFSKRLIYVVDPHGAIGVAPEEVGLLTSSDDGYDVTLGFRLEEQRKTVRASGNDMFRIAQQTIDVTIEKNGKMTGTVVSSVTAAENGVQVVPLMLAPTLRVSGVWGPGGEALDYIQEDKDRDADFAVVLQKPLKAGERSRLRRPMRARTSCWIWGAETTIWWRGRAGIRMCAGRWATTRTTT